MTACIHRSPLAGEPRFQLEGRSMTVGKLCRRAPFMAYESESLTVAAQRMRETHVGFLVVIRALPERVVGVITDRDIVTAVVARGVGPSEFTVGDVMTRDPLLIEESQSP